MSRVHDVGDADFSDVVLGSDRPVLVDFWGGWCKPCHDQERVTRDVARELSDRIRVCRVDVDRNRGTISRYGVRGVPSLLVFEGGELRASHVGKMTPEELRGFVLGALARESREES